MSLWCGSCRQEIFEGFGILYQLGRDAAGVLRFPDKKNDYVPLNSAICDRCWNGVPKEEKRTGDSAKQDAEKNTDTVFVYAPADSNNDPFWRSKTWSGIVTQDNNLTFVSANIVERHLRQSLEIITNMERAIAYRRRQRN